LAPVKEGLKVVIRGELPSQINLLKDPLYEILLVEIARSIDPTIPRIAQRPADSLQPSS
jgi:hypothetical protein